MSFDVSTINNNYTTTEELLLDDDCDYHDFIERAPVTVYLDAGLVESHPQLSELLQLLVKSHNTTEVVTLDHNQLRSFDFPVVPWPKGRDFTVNSSYCLYILSSFESEPFFHLKDLGCKILGPTCLFDLLSKSYPLASLKIGTVYSLCLNKAIIAFSGFEHDRKSELNHLTLLSHYMGARVKAEMTKSVTHLVAYDVKSTFYRDSVALAVDALSLDWLRHCWENRDNSSFCGTDTFVTKNFRIKPFTGLCLAFYGFAPKELKHMEEIALENGATTTDVSNSTTTHVVVDETASSDFYFLPRENVWVVTSQWFWKCVQLQIYTLEDPYCAPQIEVKKKKLPRDEQSPKPTGLRSPPTNRRSPLSNFFTLKRKSHEKPANFASSQCLSKRSHNFMELLHTEKNYVEILRILVEVFKTPLEKSLSEKYGPIMSTEDIKIVFGAIPDIFRLHLDLAADLEALASVWSESSLIGPTFDKYVDGFMRVYPAFINYFEIIKETVNRVDSENQRFHAFLKCCLSQQRCGRQTLCELLIRPVQRLPSIILLLKELLKHTNVGNPDYACIERAIDSLTFALNQINEDKRKAGEQLQMVEVYNNIEGCPAYVLSSQRHFVMKLDANELQDAAKTKGRIVTIFILSDSVEIAKKRQSRMFGPNTVNSNIKPSPSITSLTKARTHKHCFFLTFKQIVHVVELSDSTHPGFKNTFGLRFRPNENDLTEVTYFYRVLGEKAPSLKQEIISLLLKSMACARSLLDSEIADNSDINTPFKRPDSPLRSLGKAIEQLAIKTTRRMSRAFSIKNRTDFLPRSISVTSQIPSDVFSTPLNIGHRRSRKSVQVDCTNSATLDLNSEIVCSSPTVSVDLNRKPPPVIDGKRYSRKKISLWRRSVQADDIIKR